MDPDAAAVIERARAIADTVLFPRAQDVDRGVATPTPGCSESAGRRRTAGATSIRSALAV